MGGYTAHPTALLTVALEQRAEAKKFRKFSAPSCLIRVPKQQAIQALGPFLLPCQDKEANS